jgi:hypothetical protein
MNNTADVVYTGPGHSVTVDCIIQADPDADVAWYHNSSDTAIDFNRRRNIKRGKEKVGNSTYRWTLEFVPVQSRDLGIYKCEGRNEIDVAYGVVTLSPLPYQLEIISSPVSDYSDRYILQWSVLSHSQLIDFTLFLKQLNDTWDTQWFQYSIPATVDGNSLPKHVQEFVLRGLVPGSKYLATMRARNTYGDSRMSEEFRFRTALGLLNAVPEPLTIVLTLLFVAMLQCFQW